MMNVNENRTPPLLWRASFAAGVCFSLLVMAFLGERTLDVFANSGKEVAVKRNYVMAPSAPAHQTVEEAALKSTGCISCHTSSGHKTMHENPGVVIGCTDCHGGDAAVMNPGGGAGGAGEAGLDVLEGKLNQRRAGVGRQQVRLVAHVERYEGPNR